MENTLQILFSALSKYKIFDNLRRSLVPVSLMILLIFGWSLFPATHIWLGIVLTIVLLPIVVNNFIDLLRKPRDMRPTQHVYSVFQRSVKQVLQVLVSLACLPFEAWYSFLAIVKTVWRLTVSKKHLLEWVPSEQIDQRLGHSISQWFLILWIGPVVALAVTALLIIESRFETLSLSAPLLMLWFFSPLIMLWLSTPFKHKQSILTSGQVRFLHREA